MILSSLGASFNFKIRIAPYEPFLKAVGFKFFYHKNYIKNLELDRINILILILRLNSYTFIFLEPEKLKKSNFFNNGPLVNFDWSGGMLRLSRNIRNKKNRGENEFELKSIEDQCAD